MRYFSITAILLAHVLGISGCDDNASNVVVDDHKKEMCDDAIDNNDDGATDCDDADCAEHPLCTPSTDSTGSKTPTFRVFLLLGQSNMVGYPQAALADKTEDDRITVLGYEDCDATGRKTDEWDVAFPPLHECHKGIGPGDYFAKTLIEALPEGDTIGLVPCAKDGQRIEVFMKGKGSEYDRIIERARIAQDDGGVIEGFLFHQGESNCEEADWPEKVNTFVNDLKSDLELGDIPFLAGELLYTGDRAAHNALIHDLPDIIPNTHIISAEGLKVDPNDTNWGLHFSRDAQVEFGKRYADAMIDALGL